MPIMHGQNQQMKCNGTLGTVCGGCSWAWPLGCWAGLGCWAWPLGCWAWLGCWGCCWCCIKNVAWIAKAICLFEHHIMRVQRNEWYNVIILAVSHVYVFASRVIRSTPQPFLKDAVNHGVMIDEDWVISRRSHISHNSCLIVIKPVAEPAYS